MCIKKFNILEYVTKTQPHFKVPPVFFFNLRHMIQSFFAHPQSIQLHLMPLHKHHTYNSKIIIINNIIEFIQQALTLDLDHPSLLLFLIIIIFFPDASHLHTVNLYQFFNISCGHASSIFFLNIISPLFHSLANCYAIEL